MFRTIETTGLVNADHTLTLKLPDDVPAGSVKVFVVTEVSPSARMGIDWRTWTTHDLEMIDPNCTFRREDIYDDDGR